MTMMLKGKIKNEEWVWIIVYRNANWKELKTELTGWLVEEIEGKEINLVIMGDFNARTGEGVEEYRNEERR